MKNKDKGKGRKVKEKQAVVRPYCSCGWQEFIDFDPKLTNEEIIPLVDERIKNHMKKAHNQEYIVGRMKHINHEKIKLQPTT